MIFFIVLIFNYIIDYIEIMRNILVNYFKDKIPQDNIHILKIINKIDLAEKNLKNYNPISIIIAVLISLMIVNFITKKLKQIWRNINSFEKIKTLVIRFLLNFSKFKNDVNKSKQDIRNLCGEKFKINQMGKKMDFLDNGLDKMKVINKLRNIREVDLKNLGEDSTNTRITGCLYVRDSEIEDICAEAMKLYSYANLLHPDVFVSARFLESELVRIGKSLFSSNDEVVGLTTSGGSESILTSILAYRNRAFQRGVEHPEMIIPITAHAAFIKAGDAFGVKVITIPYDKNYQVDISKVKRAINSNTIALVGSFPNFPNGVCDNIEALSELAVKYDIPLHVDACLGGFLAAFYRYSNIQIPKFDFTLPGVTSISADLHKYGLCPKGISLLLYKNKEYRKFQYFIYPKWMGGVYPSPTLAGSRSPAFVAASWAILHFLGKNTYISQAKKIHEAIVKIKKFCKDNFKELEIIGNPSICVIAFTGSKCMYIYDEMNRRKWGMNIINNPQGFSFVITSANLPNIENGTLLKDLKESYDLVMKSKDLKLSEHCKMYGMTLAMPESIVKDNLDVLVDCMLD